MIATASTQNVCPSQVNSTGDYYIASANNDFVNRNIKCINPKSRSCHIVCGESTLCNNSYIECINANECIIECTADSSCQEIEINILNTDTIDITCGGIDACFNSSISIIGDNNNQHNIEIKCDAYTACRYSTITSTMNHTYLWCGGGDSACRYLQFYVDTG